MENDSQSQVKTIINNYLTNTRVLQLATSRNNQPYCINLHFYSDLKMNLYFSSGANKRHSSEIATNNRVCAAIHAHEDSQSEPWVAGISIEGKCTIATTEEIEKIADEYCKKLGKDRSLIEKTLDTNSGVSMYKVTPSEITIFDNKNFPNNPRETLTIGS